MKKQSDLNWLKGYCKRFGLYVYTYSPGDGVTRYRFSLDEDSDYCGCNGLRTVLGYERAEIFADGFGCGLYSIKDYS